MSIRALNAVIEHSGHTGDEYVLLLMIANCINRHTGEAFPSIAYLMKRARMGERRVYRALKRLRAGGELQVVSAKGGGCHRSNRYSLNPLPISNTDIGDSINTVAGDSIKPHRNTDKSSIGILTNRAGNTDNGSGTILLKNPFQKPIRAETAVTDVPAHAKKVGKPTKSKRPRIPKTEWPDGLDLTPADREFATRLGINPDTEFIAWHDDCLAHGRRYVRWDYAWRTRCRNAVGRFAVNGAVSRPAPPLTARQMAEQATAHAWREA
jgi:hypothetical protein